MAGDDEARALRAELEVQRQVVASQAAALEALLARLDALERAVAPATSVEGGGSGREVQSDHEGTNQATNERGGLTDRRGLLRQAGVAVAGVATGAVVLGQASPAAAAAGTFDGNPAVLGTANPTTGIGVRGDTTTGIGVQGRSTATSGTVTGVQGDVASSLGVAVRGVNSSTSGSPVGVRGQASAQGGAGVDGVNTATAGDAIAVRGTTSSTDGIGVLGDAKATGAPAVTPSRGVEGRSAGPGGVGVVGHAQATTGSGIGVSGLSDAINGVGVRGEASTTDLDASRTATVGVEGRAASRTGIGVRGLATATTTGSPVGPTIAIGVLGRSEAPNGQGVNGFAASATGTTLGVRGGVVSPDGIGVAAATFGAGGVALQADASGTFGATGADIRGDLAALLTSSVTHLRFAGAPTPPLATIKSRSVGDVVFDSGGDLWLCVVSGSPGTWRRLGGTSTAGSLVLLSTPVRVYDSRPGENPLNSVKGPIAGGTTRTIDLTNNGSGVPAGATGALVTLTVVNTSANGGFLALFKNGAPTPATSSINWSAANQVVATTTVTALDAAAKAAVFCPANSSTNLFLDVIGFYQ